MAKEKDITKNELLVIIKANNKELFKTMKASDNELLKTMKASNKELLDIMIEQFISTDKRFESIDKKFDRVFVELINIKEELKDKIGRDEFNQRNGEILSAIDNITSKHTNHESEHIANLGAHMRMQGEINDCRKKLGLKINPISA